MPSMKSVRQIWCKLSLVEWLIVAAMCVLLAALLTPSVQWASSGTTRLPVRVVVFDAVQARPIKGAQVVMLHAPPLRDAEAVREFRGRISPDMLQQQGTADQHITTTDGSAVLEHEFRTGASHRRPEPHVHLTWAWVVVTADRYGGAVVPVRYESQSTATLKGRGELVVPVGLIPCQ